MVCPRLLFDDAESNDGITVEIIKQYQQAALAGDAEAAALLGLIYLPPAFQLNADCRRTAFWLKLGIESGSEFAALMLVLLYSFNPSFSPGDKTINGYALIGGFTFDADIYYLLNHAQDIKTEAMDSAAYRSAFSRQLYRPALRNRHDEKPAVYLWANELTKIYCKASADVASATDTDRASQ